jgi:hypothetical protein
MGCAQTILGFTTAAPTVVDELSGISMVMRSVITEFRCTNVDHKQERESL